MDWFSLIILEQNIDMKLSANQNDVTGKYISYTKYWISRSLSPIFNREECGILPTNVYQQLYYYNLFPISFEISFLSLYLYRNLDNSKIIGLAGIYDTMVRYMIL